MAWGWPLFEENCGQRGAVALDGLIKSRGYGRVDHGWYPPDIGAIELSKQAEEERASRSKNPEHTTRKLTRPCEWLRREAISNLGIMQAL